MQTWVVDAFNIPIDEVDEFEASLLHRTPAIERFLANDNRQSHVVVGPKGFGKTLLIRAKRVKLMHDGIVTLPRNTPVDKPVGTTPIFSQEQARHILNERSYWSNVWMCAFIICFVKEHKSFDGEVSKLYCSEVSRCLSTPTMSSPSDMLKVFLRLNPSEYFQLVEDIDVLTPSFRAIHSSTYLFLDNVDEFFDIHLPLARDFRGAVHGVRKREFWHSAQIGAVDAARELSRINSHLRVYCSIRKEALEEAIRHDTQALQIRGACLELEYSRSDLRAILIKNIEAESDSVVVDRKATDPFERWVGKEGAGLEHDITGEIEEIADYIIRHSLRRPRDIIFIGRDIAQLAPGDRSPARIKEIVNAAAAVIARDYMAECRPHLSGFDPDLLFPLIESNVLGKQDIEALTLRYADAYAAKYQGDAEDTLEVFATLYRLGLMGYVSFDRSKRIQVFRSPGGPAVVQSESLPDAEQYLIHPVLSDLIKAKLPAEYARNLNRMNIIAPDRAWRMDSDGFFAIQGDIVGFSETMEGVGYPEFVERFRRLVREAGVDLQCYESVEGDSVMFADQNPRKVIDAAHFLLHELLKFEPAKSIRFGADYGVMVVKKARKDRPASAFGMPLQIAARTRHYADPGELRLTDEFRTRLAAVGLELRPLRRVGEVNISKEGEAPKNRVLWSFPLDQATTSPLQRKVDERSS